MWFKKGLSIQICEEVDRDWEMGHNEYGWLLYDLRKVEQHYTKGTIYSTNFLAISIISRNNAFCLKLLSKITRATPVIISNESKANSLNNQFAFVLLDVSWTKTILYEGLYGRMSITQSKKGYSSSFNASNDAIYKHIPQFSNTYWCLFGSVLPTI